MLLDDLDNLLELAEHFAAGARNGPALKLKEALRDYNNICVRLKDEGLRPVERTQWIEIRNELLAEVSQLTTRLRQNHH